MKTVYVLGTGGTIASVPADAGRSAAGVLDAAGLLAQLSEVGAEVDLRSESVLQKQSSAINDEDWIVLAGRCQALIGTGTVSGIVITHGTDTLEETAYFLDCVLDTSRVAVVMTGSQRVPQALGSDVERNLVDAISAAAAEACRGLGVLVAFNQTLFSARFVRKTSSFRVDGFDAPLWGALGLIDSRLPTRPAAPCVLQRAQRQPLLPLPAALPRVDVLTVHAGASPVLLSAVLASGPAGLVIEGLGRGHVPPTWMAALRAALAEGMVVALCSTTLHGAMAQSYEFEGSLYSLESAGAIAVSHLSARKARARLALLLAAGLSGSQALRAGFAWQL